MGLSVHSAKEGHSIRRQGTGSCSHGSRLYFDFLHQCSYLCAISSSWTWTPRANPCHGQGGRCQVSRGHLSPADVHMNGSSTRVLLVLMIIAKNWHPSSDGKKFPLRVVELGISECSFSPARLSCLDLEFLCGLSMSTKFAVCFEFHFCGWTSYSCLRSGGCGHGARGCLDNKSTEH